MSISTLIVREKESVRKRNTRKRDRKKVRVWDMKTKNTWGTERKREKEGVQTSQICRDTTQEIYERKRRKSEIWGERRLKKRRRTENGMKRERTHGKKKEKEVNNLTWRASIR
jgi:hypothetical protein